MSEASGVARSRTAGRAGRPPRRRRPAPGRRRRPRARRALGRLAAAAAAALVLALALGAGALLLVYPRRAGPGEGLPVELEVPRGAGAAETARLAERAGAVGSARLFALYLRLSGAAGRLKAGRHLVRDDWSPAELAETLARPGRRAQVRVTLREGESRHVYAAELDRLGVVARDELLDATEDAALLEELGLAGASAEGYLYPETYLMEPGTPAAEVVRRLVGTFRERTAPLVERSAEALGALERDLAALEVELAARRGARGEAAEPRRFGALEAAVILASIVEAETPHADERPTVAAVYLNRLRSPAFPFRRLQADPTVRYGCEAEPAAAESCRVPPRPLTRAQLADPANRYNTYAHPSLPPGPIGNPSLRALEAVLAPAETDALYFVAQPGGRHAFSRSLEEHNAAVARLRASEASAPVSVSVSVSE